MSDEGESDPVDGVPLCGSTTNYIQFLMRKTEPSVGGVVLTPEGRPVTNATVFVGSVELHRTVKTSTDACGRFSARGFGSGGVLDISVMEPTEHCSESTNVHVGACDVTVVLKRAPMITGRVLYMASSAPVTNFVVEQIRVRRSVQNPEGRFKMNLPSRHGGPWPDTFTIAVDGYPPVSVECKIGRDGKCDLGDILIGAAATVRGRVVNHEGVPMVANVDAVRRDADDHIAHGYVRSAQGDGSFVVTNIAPGKVQISASHNMAGTAYSGLLTLNPGDDITLPDLVIVTTGCVPVDIQLVMPDGTPAANAFVSRWYAFADDSGTLCHWLPIGEYRGLRVCMEVAPGTTGFIEETSGISHYAEPFSVMPTTRSLRVRLHTPEKITGVIRVDGKPLTDLVIFFQPAAGRNHFVHVTDGAFEVDAPSGTYLLNCQGRHVGSLVELRGGEKNIVELTSGTASISAVLPMEGPWRIMALLKCGAYHTVIASCRQTGTYTRGAIDEIPAGEYRIEADCAAAGVYTNITKDITLGEGERKEITF
ncbi:carboxypeptidase regulatory-like domain-containing protein [bacterium]|nr:carboxypeptidase regulatory-like domain-containing protein [bacterium]